MLGSAATVEHSRQIGASRAHSKSANRKPLGIGSILDKAFRLSNAASDPVAAASWVRFLASMEKEYSLPAASLDRVLKPFGTFAVHRLSMRQRCALLLAHYMVATRALPVRTFAALWAGSRIRLGSLLGRKGDKYHLFLASSEHCAREGEYSFILTAVDGFELARLTFTLVSGLDGDVGTQVLIGGLQGASSFFGEGGKARVISATRDLSGLRPKMAVFVAASAFGQCVGASNLVGVTNDRHSINADAWYQRRRMVADYDAFWAERGGAPVDWGFRMPLNLEPRSTCPARNNQRSLVADLVFKLFARDAAEGGSSPNSVLSLARSASAENAGNAASPS